MYFTWIFIELNFTVALLLIRKTWKDWFPSKVGEGGEWQKDGPRNFKKMQKQKVYIFGKNYIFLESHTTEQIENDDSTQWWLQPNFI